MKTKFLFLLCLLMNSVSAGAQVIDAEKAYAYMLAGDYLTCINAINEATWDDDFLKKESVDDILFCGITCAAKYLQLLEQESAQISFSDKEKREKNIKQREDIWESALNFIDYYDLYFNEHYQGGSIKTKNKLLSQKISCYSWLATETTEESQPEFLQELESLHLQYINDIFPNLNSGALELTDIMTGYSIVMDYYSLNENYEALNNTVFNFIMPWFKKNVVNNDKLDKTTKILLLNQYRSFVNVMNIGLEGEYSPTDDYISKVMAMNIQMKNFAYLLKGNDMYKNHVDDQWQQIQKQLKDNEVAIEFCNAKGEDEHIWAFIIDNKCKYPTLKYCGHSYWAGQDVFGFSHLITSDEISKYVNVYFSSTEEMAFIDLGHTEQAHKLHSLSELLMPKIASKSQPTVCSFANISYSSNGIVAQDGDEKRGAKRTTAKLEGSKRELDFLKSTMSTRLTSFENDKATKETFLATSGKSIDILHISTHGFFDKEGSKSTSIQNVEASVTGETILANCGLILSGYDDNKQHGLVTGDDIAKMDLSRTGLVILNACETGIGDIRFNDTYSLTEAFHTAGARYIISTTDRVEDNAAKIFFTTFMEEVFHGKSYHDAFVAARKASNTPEKFIFWE